LNRNLKLIIVAFISFWLGVAATIIYGLPAQYDKDRKLVNTIISEKNKIQERKSFFVKAKEAIPKAMQNLSKSDDKASATAVVTSPIDYMNLTEKLEKFRESIYKELKKKFKTISLDPKDIDSAKIVNRLKNMLELMFNEKELWYKISFDDEFSQTKITLFFRYFACQKKDEKPAIKLNDICYTMQMYNFKNDKWSETDITSQVNGLVRYNENMYTHIELNGMGDFSKDTNALYAVVPVPNDQRPIQFLKYEAGKFIWVEGQEIKWALSSQKETNKFSEWAVSYGIKHGELPEQ
jgi:hypothetical protein